MSSCVIFGGAGFVGTHLARHFLETGRFSHIHLADIRASELEGTGGITTSITDVRRPIPVGLLPSQPEWIFNLAAVHREPGHEPWEYYETNINGALHVCEYAATIGCDNLYFTSSLSVYGPTTGPAEESSPTLPTTPYGGSKYPAEIVHRMWHRGRYGRRLIISRPGVLYGPGDPGNIMRMMKAIKKGYFFYPGSPSVLKSYGYIYGFLDSVDFIMDRDDPYVLYNYSETPTQSLGELVKTVQRHLDARALTMPIPLWALLPVAALMQKVTRGRSPIHPVRVRKAATATHIIPRKLLDMGFEFKYDFLSSILHWSRVEPGDFQFANLSGQDWEGTDGGSGSEIKDGETETDRLVSTRG